MIQSSTIKATDRQAPTNDIAKVAGRGAIYITIAKLWFIVSGYGIAFTLARLMTDADYGNYKIVTGVVSIINAVIVTGTYQTVSKHVSQEQDKADSVKSKALMMQVMVGGLAALAFFLLAPVIASYLNDPGLAKYLRIASLITLSYAFYSVFTGYFNGQKRFLAQSALDMTYSTLKLVSIVVLVWLGFGVAGAVGGFALAAASVLLISAVVAGKGERKGEVSIGSLFKFQAYILLFTLVLNLLQKVDLILIKALSSTDAAEASRNAGYYGASIDLANISYQIIISVTFVIFPLVSEATFADDRRRTQSYISNTLRYSLMIMALTATLFSANAGEVLRVIYRDSYQAGSPALAVVAFGMLFFGLLYVITTIISASGRPTVSLMIGIITLGVSAALNAVLIPRYGLVGAGAGTTIAMFVGTVAGGAYLLTRFGALIDVISLARIAVCAGLTYAASIALAPQSKVMIIVQLVALSLLYFVALLFTKEIGRTDLEAIKKIVKR